MSDFGRQLLLFAFITALVAVCAVALIQSGISCVADPGYCRGLAQ